MLSCSEIFVCIICFPCISIASCFCDEDEQGKTKCRCSKECCYKIYCHNCSSKKYIIYFFYLGMVFIASIIFTFTYEKYDDDLNEIIYQIEKTLNSIKIKLYVIIMKMS